MAGRGMFYWSELMTRDPDTAKSFYEKTIGRSFDSMPMPNGNTYLIAKMGDTVDGFFDTNGTDMPEMPEHWFSYISVDDVEARCEKAKAAGGKVTREAFDVPGVGRIAIIQQPGGGMVGRMTPALQSAPATLSLWISPFW